MFFFYKQWRGRTLLICEKAVLYLEHVNHRHAIIVFSCAYGSFILSNVFLSVMSARGQVVPNACRMRTIWMS